MRGKVTKNKYGLLPSKLLDTLLKEKIINYNLKHKLPTFLLGSFIGTLDNFREKIAKPIYRSLPTNFKAWYDSIRYKI